LVRCGWGSGGPLKGLGQGGAGSNWWSRRTHWWNRPGWRCG
jgi:hypothetical protein